MYTVTVAAPAVFQITTAHAYTFSPLAMTLARAKKRHYYY